MIMSVANMVSRATVGSPLSASIMAATTATSMMITESVSTTVPIGSPRRSATASARCDAATAQVAMTPKIHAKPRREGAAPSS